MPTSKRDLLAASLLALAVLGAYAGFLSKAYVFEGLIRALPIETGRWGHLFPGNYLLYGPLGLIFHTLLQAVGLHQMAVTSLQMLDALLGAAGIFIFFLTLRKLGGEVFPSVVWSVILASSLGYWLWSTEAEDYILSTVLLLVTFYFLVKAEKQGRMDPVVIGALHGAAILGHIINVIFGAVVLWTIVCLYGRNWRKPVLRYATAAALVALIPYGAVLALIQKPVHFRDALSWFEGSAGLGQGALSTGGGYSAAKMGLWLKTSLHILVSFSPSYTNPPAWGIAHFLLRGACLLLAIFLGVTAVRFWEIYRRSPAVVGGCAIWLAAYACVFMRWQPETLVYRVSDLVPVCLLLFLAAQSIPTNRGLWRAMAAALACCLVVGNLGAEIYPRSFASNNPDLVRMAFLKANTMENDWITGSNGLDEIYIPYFAQRRPIVLGPIAQEQNRLPQVIDTLLAHGQVVMVTSHVLDQEPWKLFFARYRLVLQARDPEGFAVYRLTKPA